MMRWPALESIGGFPTDSVTEDFLITLRLQENGWRTVYLNEPLTEGLAPEGVAEYIVQRARWCLGLIQIVRGRSGPLFRNRLRLIDRLGLIDSFLFWSTTYVFRLACLLVPLLYWYAGITAVNASVPSVLEYFGPFYIFSLAALRWVSVGHGADPAGCQPDSGRHRNREGRLGGPDQAEGHAFKVTAKGGDRAQTVVQWPLLRPLAIIFILTLAGIFFTSATDIQFDRDAGDGVWVVLFWTLYNLLVLGVAMAVCIEVPCQDRAGDRAGANDAAPGRTRHPSLARPADRRGGLDSRGRLSPKAPRAASKSKASATCPRGSHVYARAVSRYPFSRTPSSAAALSQSSTHGKAGMARCVSTLAASLLDWSSG
jgi:cellulose synthase (UDP-forming)